MEIIISSSISLVLSIWAISLILKTRPINKSFKIVLIILVNGIIALMGNWSNIENNKNTYLIIFVSSLLGFMFGFLRGFTITIWYDVVAEKWLRKGTWMSVCILFVGLIITHIIIGFITPNATEIMTISQTLHMGISMLGSRLVWHYRINRMQFSR